MGFRATFSLFLVLTYSTNRAIAGNLEGWGWWSCGGGAGIERLCGRGVLADAVRGDRDV